MKAPVVLLCHLSLKTTARSTIHKIIASGTSILDVLANLVKAGSGVAVDLLSYWV
jgi:hypothetical protein